MRSTHVIMVRDTVARMQMQNLARERGWPCTGKTDRGHLVVASEQWTPQDGLTVTWVEDHPCDVRMVLVQGQPEAVVATNHALCEVLPHDTAAALRQAADDEAPPEQLIRLCGKLACCRPDTSEPDHLAVVRRMLGHRELAVRRAAVRTTYRYDWPELVPIVAARRDADANLAPQLGHLLAFLLSRRAP